MKMVPPALALALSLGLVAASCGGSGKALPSAPATTGTLATPASAGPLLQVQLPAVDVAPGTTTLRVAIRPPAGFGVSGEASSRFTLDAANRSVIDLAQRDVSWDADLPDEGWPLTVRVAPGSTTLTASGTIYFCRAGEEEVCRFQRLELTLPVNVSRSSAASDFELSYRLSPLSSP